MLYILYKEQNFYDSINIKKYIMCVQFSQQKMFILHDIF